MSSLNGKHALVTGGGTGIGAAVALALCDQGAKVTITGRRPEPLADIAGRAKGIAVAPGDVTDPASVASMTETARAEHGPIDILIANAGGAEAAPFQHTSQDLWDSLIAVNLTGAFLCAKAVVPDMLERGWGRLVFVSSTAGLEGQAYVAAYCAAKHGVVGLARALSCEYAKSGITANALCPGFAETDLLHRSIDNIVSKTGRSEEQARASLQATNPHGKFIQPEEVADAAVWLCGDGAAPVNGQAIALAGRDV